jgi:hypothetical protein
MSSDLIGGYLIFYLKWANFRLDALLADKMLTKLYTTGPLSLFFYIQLITNNVLRIQFREYNGEAF